MGRSSRSQNASVDCDMTCSRIIGSPEKYSAIPMAGWANEANTKASRSCSGSLRHKDCQPTRCDAQTQPSSTGYRKRCCTSRAQYGAKMCLAPGSMSMLACMPRAYSTFEHATYTQNMVRMIRFWRTPGVATKARTEVQKRPCSRNGLRTGAGSATAAPGALNSSDGKAFTGYSPLQRFMRISYANVTGLLHLRGLWGRVRGCGG